MIPYILFITVPLILLGLFLGLVGYEERTGRRVVMAGRRHHLDLKVARATFVIRHVDWGAFTNDLARTSIERFVHDVAHTTLIFVRALERELTRLVRTLRARRDEPLFPVRDTQKPALLASTITYVKKTVNRSRKQIQSPDPEGRAE